MTKICFKPTNILLPSESVDLEKWAVIACDQYTSQPEYWKKVEEFTGETPTAYRIIYPEVYLREGKKRIETIHRYMQEYLRERVLSESIKNGFVLTERQVSDGTRLGLIGALDLEQYEFREGCQAAVRATEGTILSRIPPRVSIRRGAYIESPHVMVLLDDMQEQVTESLYKNRSRLRKLYDFELMMEGGHIAGYAIEGEQAAEVSEQIARMQNDAAGAIMAVGDGNHSLAAAKAYWDGLRETLSEEEREVHPARYALVELVNLYSSAIVFEPIHRVLFNTSMEQLVQEFGGMLEAQEIPVRNGSDFVFLNGDSCQKIGLDGQGKALPVDVLQKFLDEYLERNKGVSIDYIHGEEAVRMLVSQREDAVGILLKGTEKTQLFPFIKNAEVLPRKSFSIGEADDKRFYLECRKLV